MQIIKASHLSKAFGDNKVLRDISFSVEKGQVLSVIGPSGSGKSTMLRIVTQLEKADDGTLVIGGDTLFSSEKGKAIYSRPDVQKRIGLKTGLVFQSFNLFPHFSVMRNITEAQRAVLKRSKAEAEAKAEELLRKMNLLEKAKAYPCELSGGQRQRVSIARALALDPEVLFFDEPTSALDPELTQEILKVIRELAQEKMTMVVVTHEMSFAKGISDYAIFMDQGVIVEEGSPDQVFDNPENDRTRKFLSSYLN
ncbi:MAG: amino acid ABC transporter ATP-binding protein [Candidatus Ornithospirochaeta sp.]|nr:amino acid ABC transporter ATP-binding protein [Candidatus Ornithospirochaeta sp.]